MHIYTYLLALFAVNTLSVTLHQNVKLCGRISIGREWLSVLILRHGRFRSASATVSADSFPAAFCFAAWLLKPVGYRSFSRDSRVSGGLVPVLSVPPPRGSAA